MATLPKHNDPTIEAMNKMIVQSDNQPARPYLGMSGIGRECNRQIWYEFRWAAKRTIAATGLRAIQDGFANEDLTAKRLRLIEGIQLWTHDEESNDQIACSDLSGHFRGHLDGIIMGILQAPKTAHVWENKAVNQKKFDALKKLILELGEKNALQKWDAVYFAQAQLYMHYQKLTRHYITVSTPGGRDTVGCRTEYNRDAALHYIEKARAIISSEAPPTGISTDPAFWQCKFCDFHGICHQNHYPQPTCRSCAHVTAMLDETGGWHCRKWDDRIPVEAQRTGCDQHIYHPEILHFLRPVNGSMEQNWVEYQDKNGTAVVNGSTGLSSETLYVWQKPTEEHVADEELQELATDCQIEPQTLLNGQVDEQDWPVIYQSGIKLFARYSPEKTQRLTRLLSVIDSAYLAVLEGRPVADHV